MPNHTKTDAGKDSTTIFKTLYDLYKKHQADQATTINQINRLIKFNPEYTSTPEYREASKNFSIEGKKLIALSHTLNLLKSELITEQDALVKYQELFGKEEQAANNIDSNSESSFGYSPENTSPSIISDKLQTRSLSRGASDLDLSSNRVSPDSTKSYRSIVANVKNENNENDTPMIESPKI